MEPRSNKVWRLLDPELWELTQNPWVVLQTVSRDKLERKLAESSFRENISALFRAKRHTTETAAWFQQHHSQAPLTCAAYFSMEFMLSEALPIYSGGLGNMAGDQLKAASDLGVPVVGVGCSTNKAIFARSSTTTARNRPCSPTTIPDSCRSRRYATERRMVQARDRFARATRSGFAPGRSRLVAKALPVGQ